MRTICTTLAAAALLLAPALASGQPGTYEFANGTLVAPGPYSADGCGTYLCLNFQAGAGGDGILVRTLNSTPTLALVALGATSYEWRFAGYVGQRACYGSPYNVCDIDGGAFNLMGDNVQVTPSEAFGYGPHAFGATLYTYSLGLAATVDFTAYDATGAVVASDTFAPSLFITPEPGPLALTVAGLALVGAGAWRRRRGA